MDPQFSSLLNSLPHGSNVAVVAMTGSCCPITLGHVQGFIEARRIFLGECQRPAKLQHFDEVLGLLSLNGDGHVSCKLRAKGQPSISLQDRAELVKHATAELPWLKFSLGSRAEFAALAKNWRHLNFVKFSLNGADDVVTYQKWNGSRESNRFITMGRPGYTEKVVAAMHKAKIDPQQGFFILGPELPDISSTEVRRALRARDLNTLEGLLHPAVLQWCLEKGPYKALKHIGEPCASSGLSEVLDLKSTDKSGETDDITPSTECIVARGSVLGARRWQKKAPWPNSARVTM
jgi:nicotinic acid mononucleotide adenylyltransferase